MCYQSRRESGAERHLPFLNDTPRTPRPRAFEPAARLRGTLPPPPNPNSPRPPSSLLLSRPPLHRERHTPCTPRPHPASFPHGIASTWHHLNPASGPAATVHPLPPFIRTKASPGGSRRLSLLGPQYLQRRVVTAGAPMLEE